MSGSLFVGLPEIRRDGEGGITEIEGDAHALSWGEAGVMEPEVGDLGPGHEGRRGLLGLRRAVLGRVAQHGPCMGTLAR